MEHPQLLHLRGLCILQETEKPCFINSVFFVVVGTYGSEGYTQLRYCYPADDGGYTADKVVWKDAPSDLSYGEFLSNAPAYHPRAELIKGKVCGVQVETIDDPLMKKVRQLDKLVDELAKGKSPEEIKR